MQVKRKLKVVVVVVVVFVAVVVISERVQFQCHDATSLLRIHRLREPVMTSAVLFREWTAVSPDDVSATSDRSSNLDHSRHCCYVYFHSGKPDVV